MKRGIILLTTLALIASCQSGPNQDLSQLQGYWEIQSVVTADGQEKQFGVNMLIDYFELQDLNGSRSKMQPQLDGSYKKQPSTERFQVRDSAGSYYLFYTTPYDSWVERLQDLTKETMVLQIPSGNTYHYKRYQPLDLTE